MVSFTNFIALSAIALATPLLQHRQMDIPNDWDWHVEGWHAGCSRSGCSYNFNVTVPSILDQIAGVKAYCSGPETGNTYRSCQILEGVNDGVSAKFGPRNESSPELGPEKIFVSFELGSYEERPAYNFSGSHDAIYNAFVAPLQEFDVTPTEVFAID